MSTSPDLCPLCRQRALTLNAEGTLLTCNACGAKADFDAAARRVRYTVVPEGYAQVDGALRGRWLARAEVFEVVAALTRLPAQRHVPAGMAWAVGAGVVLGVMGLTVAFMRGMPAQPQVREGNIGAAPAAAMPTGARASAIPLTPSATHIPQPTNFTVEGNPTDVQPSPSPTGAASATPTSTQPALVAIPISATQLALPPAPQPNEPTPLPTVDGRRIEPTATATPLPATTPAALVSTPTNAATASLPVPVNTPAVAQPPLPLGSDHSTAVATLTALPTQTPTAVVPTETSAPTETPIPTPTPVPATFGISNLVYVGGSTFEEYLELTNLTDQVMAVPIHTWKMRISAAVGQTELKLGDYLRAPFDMPARQSCRLYTSKRAASPNENSPCGFLSLGLPDDVDGLYPDKPGVTVTLLNSESRVMAVFRY